LREGRRRACGPPLVDLEERPRGPPAARSTPTSSATRASAAARCALGCLAPPGRRGRLRGRGPGRGRRFVVGGSGAAQGRSRFMGSPGSLAVRALGGRAAVAGSSGSAGTSGTLVAVGNGCPRRARLAAADMRRARARAWSAGTSRRMWPVWVTMSAALPRRPACSSGGASRRHTAMLSRSTPIPARRTARAAGRGRATAAARGGPRRRARHSSRAQQGVGSQRESGERPPVPRRARSGRRAPGHAVRGGVE
jgi:hypothetical protein